MRYIGQLRSNASMLGPGDPACLPPRAPSQQIAAGGHEDSRVELPAQVPEGVRRDEKIEACHTAARTPHTSHLGEGRFRVRDVAQQVREADGVKRPGRKRQLLVSRLL